MFINLWRIYILFICVIFVCVLFSYQDMFLKKERIIIIINFMNMYIEVKKSNVSTLYIDIRLMYVVFKCNTLKDKVFQILKVLII